MARATILTVDDDPAVLQAITRDLRSRYGDRYRLARAISGAEALRLLEEIARRDQSVALIVSDHRMPEMTGWEQVVHRMKEPSGEVVVVDRRAARATGAIEGEGRSEPEPGGEQHDREYVIRYPHNTTSRPLRPDG